MLPESVLRNPNAYRYVSSMLNITYLTGFSRNPDRANNMFWLQQNNNLAQAIPIRVSPSDTLPKDKTPVTVLCHLIGERNSEGDANLVIKAIDIQKPSVRSMPAMTTWIRGAKESSGNADDFRPFANGQAPKVLDAEGQPVRSEFSDAEKTLRDILEATRGRLDSRLGDNSNVVLMAGFIDSMAWMEPNQYQSGGYGAIMVRQHEDVEKNIPVRLYTQPAAKALSIMRSVAPGVPVSIVGQVRMKVMPNDDGSVRSTSLHVRVSDLYRPDREKDIKGIPDWWSSIRDRVIGERNARRQSAAHVVAPPIQQEGVVADL